MLLLPHNGVWGGYHAGAACSHEMLQKREVWRGSGVGAWLCSSRTVRVTVWGAAAEALAPLEGSSTSLFSATACRVSDFDGALPAGTRCKTDHCKICLLSHAIFI